MTTESPGPRRPPPRPPKSQYLLSKEVEVLAARQAAFRLSSASYPKGKNPFGESSDEESDTYDTNSVSATKTDTNPFADCESDDDDFNSRSEDKSAAHDAKEVKNSMEFVKVNKVASNPFDAIIDQAEERTAEVGSHGTSSPPFHQKVSESVEDMGNNKENPGILKPQHKRLAPKPPVPQSNSMEVLAADTAAASPHTLPSSASRRSLEGINEIAVRSPSATYQKNSTSCENVRKKGPAPPLPVGEKREIRAEGYVNYPKLRREIEEANARLSRYDNEIEVCKAKLISAGHDPVKSMKYKKKLAKLTEKRKSAVNNRLQEQALEDRHADVEYELRGILAKQEHLRTPQEQERADELLQLLLQIVQERDKLVEERTYPERTSAYRRKHNFCRSPSSALLSQSLLSLNTSKPSADVIRSD
ncbi:hypothetical protein TcWFU_002548 [Taenia crassiceps]|uniref:BMERB domain-containing protein n=1 Tax=Taenia crassiceps TaxID=6207 RepID=A0ABR4QCK5_9CEST